MRKSPFFVGGVGAGGGVGIVDGEVGTGVSGME